MRVWFAMNKFHSEVLIPSWCTTFQRQAISGLSQVIRIDPSWRKNQTNLSQESLCSKRTHSHRLPNSRIDQLKLLTASDGHLPDDWFYPVRLSSQFRGRFPENRAKNLRWIGRRWSFEPYKRESTWTNHWQEGVVDVDCSGGAEHLNSYMPEVHQWSEDDRSAMR
jgi:hypothetical protein